MIAPWLQVQAASLGDEVRVGRQPPARRHGDHRLARLRPRGASHASSAWPWSMLSRFISSRLLTPRASTARACVHCGRSLSRARYGRRPPAGRSARRRRQSGDVRTGRRALRRSPENPASAVPFVLLQRLFRPHYHDVQFVPQFVGAIQDSHLPRKEDVPSSQDAGMKVVPFPAVPRVAPDLPASRRRGQRWIRGPARTGRSRAYPRPRPIAELLTSANSR